MQPFDKKTTHWFNVQKKDLTNKKKNRASSPVKSNFIFQGYNQVYLHFFLLVGLPRVETHH